MRIEKLTLKNFRNHSALTIQTAKHTFVLGPNASGKSSVAGAIQFLLTGKCQFLSDGGQGAEELITLGAKELSVEASIRCAHGPDAIRFTRTKSAKSHMFSMNGQPRDIRMAQEGIEKILGVSTEVLSACLNAGRFLQMTEKDQKALLSAVLASEKIRIPENVAAEMNGISPFGGGFVESVAEVDSYHKFFFDERTNVKRDLKNLGTMEAPESGDPGETADIKEKIAVLRTEKSNLEKRKANTEGTYKAQQNSYDRQESSMKRRIAVAEQSKLKESVAIDLEKQAASLDKIAEADAKVRTWEEALSKRRREIRSDYEKRIASAVTAVQIKEEAIRRLSSIKTHECPTCQRAIPPKELSAIGLRLSDELNPLKEELEKLRALFFADGNEQERDEINALIEKHGKAQAKRNELGDPAAAERKLRGHREAMVEITRCERELKELKKPAIPDLTELDTKIAELTGRIANGEAALEEARQDEQKRMAYEAWAAKKLALENRVEILNRLVEYFGPNGVKTKLVGDKIGPFTQAINDVLSRFGYGFKFTMEPYSFFVGSPVTAPQGPAFTLKQLSESEQWRFGCAFSIALAKTTGLNFVILDRADVLDAESRSALMEMIEASGLDQVICLATSDGEIPEAQEDEQFIRLGAQAVAA